MLSDRSGLTHGLGSLFVTFRYPPKHTVASRRRSGLRQQPVIWYWWALAWNTLSQEDKVRVPGSSLGSLLTPFSQGLETGGNHSPATMLQVPELQEPIEGSKEESTVREERKRGNPITAAHQRLLLL